MKFVGGFFPPGESDAGGTRLDPFRAAVFRPAEHLLRLQDEQPPRGRAAPEEAGGDHQQAGEERQQEGHEHAERGRGEGKTGSGVGDAKLRTQGSFAAWRRLTFHFQYFPVETYLYLHTLIPITLSEYVLSQGIRASVKSLKVMYLKNKALKCLF